MQQKKNPNEKNNELAFRKTEFAELQIGNPDIPVYLRVFSHLTPRNIYLTQVKTNFVPEIEEVKVKVDPKAKKDNEPESQSTKMSMAEMISLLDKDKDEFEIQKRKRPVFGSVMEVSGIVYYQGALTDVQLVDFVFSLENSGYFRDVVVDSAAAQSDGSMFFSIICGI